MISVLFTKNIDVNKASEVLGPQFIVNGIEVIKTERVPVEPFDFQYKSLIFSSINGVKFFFENGFGLYLKKENKIYCVGEKTELELQKMGFNAVEILKNAEELAKFILKNISREEFIHFCGNLVTETLRKDLLPHRIHYTKVIVYKTIELRPKINDKYHAIVFFSPSGVRSFAENNSLENIFLFSIGETTTEELKKHTRSEVFTSRENTLINLLSVIRKKFSE